MPLTGTGIGLDEGDPYVTADIAGELSRAAEHYTDRRIDMNENDLRGREGQLCPVCGGPIRCGQDVRRRLDGSYQHDVCPAS